MDSSIFEALEYRGTKARTMRRPADVAAQAPLKKRKTATETTDAHGRYLAFVVVRAHHKQHLQWSDWKVPIPRR